MSTQVKPARSLDLDSLADVLLNNPNIELRLKAARSLVKLGDQGAVEILVTASNDGDPIFRAKLVKVISRLEHPASVGIMVNAINDTDCYVRKTAVESVAIVDHPDILKALLGCLDDEEVNVRESVVIALEKSRQADLVVEMLTGALADRHWNVRRESVEIMAKIGGDRAVEPLRRMLKDEDPEVRMTALIGLANLVGAEVVSNAIDSLSDPDLSVQLEGFDIVGRFGTSSIIPILSQIASHEDCSEIVRQAALSSERQIRKRA